METNRSHHAERVLAVLREGDEAAGEIAASWKRCLLDHRLDPERPDPPTVLTNMELRHARDYAGRLLRSADPELDRLHELVRGGGYSVLMTDMSGTVIARRVADRDEAGCRKWRLWTGAVWSEAMEGTNGVGTCLAEGRPVTVHRDQHFRSRHGSLTCTVTPLYNAMGQMAGTLDVSSYRPASADGFLPMVMAAVRSAARQIERNCFHSFFAKQMILALPAPADEPSVSLLALDADRRIVGATHAARRKLGISADESLDGGLGMTEVPRESGVPVTFDEAERAVVLGALQQAQGNVTQAARVLGVSRATLHRKLRALRGD